MFLAAPTPTSYACWVEFPPHTWSFAHAGCQVAAAAVLACASAPGSDTHVDPHPPAAPLPPPRGPAAADDPDPAATEKQRKREATIATSRAILAEVADARGLPPTAELAIELIDRPGVRAFVKNAMYEDSTPAETRLMGRIESSLGVLPVGLDIERALLDLYEEGVLGIYDPKRKVLLIGEFVARPLLAMVVGHEIVHALQDMHFDLEALQQPHKRHSERDAARVFLVEGDAQAAYFAWRAGPAGAAGMSDEILATLSDNNLKLGDAVVPHPILVRALQMPYIDGAATILELARERGWAAVDELYHHLPSTSEQMLHLDKLLVREPPRVVQIDAARLVAELPNYEVVWTDEIGEASLLAMLAEVERPDAARRAAAGWGGDRYIALDQRPDPSAAPLVIGVIAWDTVADAKQFEPVFRRYLEAKKPDNFLLDRRGDKVFFATHTANTGYPGDTALADSIRSTGWPAFSIGPVTARAHAP